MQTAMQWFRNTSIPIPYISFVVKGNEQSAREQMFVRGIVAQTTCHLRHETVFSAELSHCYAIAQWFCESPELIQGYGYPDGTCLIYSTHEVSQ